MTINVIIGKGIIVENVPKGIGLIKKIQKDLTFKNPEYEQAMKYGKFISANMPAKLHMFEVDDTGNNVWFPRGYIHPFLYTLHKKKLPHIIEDETITFRELDLKFYGKLRPYQKESIPRLNSYPCGILEAETGSGKTVIANYMIALRKQPTLVIVHSKELLYQWRDEIKKFLHYDCGLVGDGNFDVRPITVAIINSVRNKLDKLKNRFGFILADECHRSITWADVLVEFKAKYAMGMSATPYRADGLGDAIFAIIGPNRHKVDSKKLRKTGAVLVPTIYKLRSSFDYMFLNDYSTMISELTNDIKRNSMIVRAIRNDLKRYNENVLIISDRKKHLETMQEMLLKQYNIKSHVLTGSVKAKLRKQMVADMKSGACQVLLATGSLISEGWDAPNLAALFSGTPVKFSGKLIQGIGRILRPKKGKKPRLYDVRDDRIPVLQYSGIHRDRIYRKKGWIK